MPLQENFLGGEAEEAAAVQLIETPQQVETSDREETAKMLSKSDPQEAQVQLTETVRVGADMD